MGGHDQPQPCRRYRLRSCCTAQGKVAKHRGTQFYQSHDSIVNDGEVSLFCVQNSLCMLCDVVWGFCCFVFEASPLFFSHHFSLFAVPGFAGANPTMGFHPCSPAPEDAAPFPPLFFHATVVRIFGCLLYLSHAALPMSLLGP